MIWRQYLRRWNGFFYTFARRPEKTSVGASEARRHWDISSSSRGEYQSTESPWVAYGDHIQREIQFSNVFRCMRFLPHDLIIVSIGDEFLFYLRFVLDPALCQLYAVCTYIGKRRDREALPKSRIHRLVLWRDSPMTSTRFEGRCWHGISFVSTWSHASIGSWIAEDAYLQFNYLDLE
jgi:hypothetical protein